MLWSGTFITAGALLVGVRAYKENKKKREMPWTYAAEKMRKRRKKSHNLLSSSFASTSGKQKSPTQRKLSQNLAIALGSLGLASAGALLYPPLSVLSWPGFFYITKYNFDDAYEALVERHTVGVDLLSSLVNVLFFISGQYVLCNLSIVTYALNRKLFVEVKENSKNNVIDVFNNIPRSLVVLSDGDEIEVPFDALNAGDVVVVKAGETIPINGMITNGSASVDEHLFTGQVQPVEKRVGDQFFARTLVLFGRVYVQVEKSGAEISAAQIDEILKKTVESKTKTQLWAQMMTDKTILPTILIGASSIPILGLMSSIAFLYSHPKYKTTIAGSAGVLSVLNFTSQKGILIKDISVFERLAEVDTVIFDYACLQRKNGILTEEESQSAAQSAAIRPEAEAVIQGLRQRNIKSIIMISEDDEASTKRVAEKLGIDHYFAEALPYQAANIIDQLQQEGKSICYIGHSSAIALAKAEVSVSLRDASTVAIYSAQVVLMDESAKELCSLFDISRQFNTNMKRTFAIVFIPHAIGLFGSLFLHFSILPVLILSYTSFFGGVVHAMLPWRPNFRYPLTGMSRHAPSVD